LKLIRIARDVELNHRGQVVNRIEPAPGETPWEVEFKRGQFKTDDPVLIEWLRDHPDNGTFYVEQGVDEPRPLVGDQLAAIMSAAAQGDTEAIAAVMVEEKETHNRKVVLDAAAAALSGIADADVPVSAEASDGPEADDADGSRGSDSTA
jgi:hypothetical protein